MYTRYRTHPAMEAALEPTGASLTLAAAFMVDDRLLATHVVDLSFFGVAERLIGLVDLDKHAVRQQAHTSGGRFKQALEHGLILFLLVLGSLAFGDLQLQPEIDPFQFRGACDDQFRHLGRRETRGD